MFESIRSAILGVIATFRAAVTAQNETIKALKTTVADQAHTIADLQSRLGSSAYNDSLAAQAASAAALQAVKDHEADEAALALIHTEADELLHALSNIPGPETEADAGLSPSQADVLIPSPVQDTATAPTEPVVDAPVTGDGLPELPPPDAEEIANAPAAPEVAATEEAEETVTEGRNPDVQA